MNELIVTESSMIRKMSSVEISELMSKRHDHVLRDIKKLIEQEAVSAPNFGEASYQDAQGKERPMYLLDFDATMTLITGYDAKRRAQVVKRWRELEQAAPTTPQLPKDFKAALLQLVDKIEENERLQITIDEQTPKVESFDRIALADGLLNLTNTAKTLQIRSIDLISFLSQNLWIYKRAGGRNWVAYQGRIQQGLLSHKVTTVQTSDGREKVVEQVLVTAKGLTRLAGSLTQKAA